MMEKRYAEYAANKAAEAISIDSPSGFTTRISDWVLAQFRELGFEAHKTVKGGVIVDLGGEDAQDALLLMVHMDTLGAMVAELKKDTGRMRLRNIGGFQANNAEGENVRLYTRSGKVYEGTIQLVNASVHVNGAYATTPRTFDSVELVLDEDVRSDKDLRALGIDVGDIVCAEPRTRITESGYIKSRFLDDKLSLGIAIGFARYLRDTGAVPKRKVYLHATVFEEVGHGGAASLPTGVTEILAVDMGCVGEGLQCTEKQVSICAMDDAGPFHYQVVSGLVEAAKREGAAYALDIYPYYWSDTKAAINAGNDLRHGLIGAGVYASHGYERSHIEGVWNVLRVLKGYLDL